MTDKAPGVRDAPKLQLARLRHPNRDLDHETFTFTAESLQALVCLLDGHVSRQGFLTWLRGANWSEEHIDDLSAVLGCIFAADAEVHGWLGPLPRDLERWTW